MRPIFSGENYGGPPFTRSRPLFRGITCRQNLPHAVRVTILPACSLSPRPRPLRSASPSIVAASCRPPSSWAGSPGRSDDCAGLTDRLTAAATSRRRRTQQRAFGVRLSPGGIEG